MGLIQTQFNRHGISLSIHDRALNTHLSQGMYLPRLSHRSQIH